LSTIISLADIYHELENIELTRDLNQRSLHVSSAGLSWITAPTMEDSQADFLQLYYFMSLTRAADLEIAKMSRKALAAGKQLASTGNEATSVGAAAALEEGDWVTPVARDLGAYLVRGVSPSRMIAQACGRMDGLTDGWDSYLHMGHLPSRVVGLISHLGTLVPIGVGCAFAEQYQGTDNVTLAFIGDGTTSTGDVHEALNIAAVMKIPLVLVIENNQWAFGTPTRLQYAVPTLALRAFAYGSHVDGYWVDGTNVLTVYETTRRALARARADRGITIIEAVSMRMQGHTLADPFTTYVPAAQLDMWRAKDPVATFADRLLQQGVATVDDLRSIDERAAREVREAAIEAEQSPLPVPHDIAADVFTPSPVHERAWPEPPAVGKRITYHQAIHEALQEELDRDSKIFMIGEDIGISDGAFKITEGFSKRYDNLSWADAWKRNDVPFEQRRVIDAPIAEAGFVGLALGACHAGLTPIVEFQYADFASEAFKMIVNYAATQVPRHMGPMGIVFRLPSGWATNTSMYHSVNPESWFASTPGLKIVAPITAFDAKGLLKAAVRDRNPVLYLEYKNCYRIRPEKLPAELNLPVPEDDYVVPIGKARVARKGTDLTIISFGSQMLRAIDAAYALEKDGASVEVIDLRTLLPLDIDTIAESVKKTSRALVTCEAPRTGSFGTTIVTEIVRMCFEYLDAPVSLVAAKDTPVPFATVLEHEHLPTVEKIIAAGHELLRY
jgi:2-oxoisovalerate dehydrogenase E1 component